MEHITAVTGIANQETGSLSTCHLYVGLLTYPLFSKIDGKLSKKGLF